MNKKLLTIFCFMTAILLSGCWVDESLPVIEHENLRLLKPSSISMIFEPEGTKATTLFEQEKKSIINGGYFGYSGSLFVPAGDAWFLDHQLDTFIDQTQDPNLSVRVIYFPEYNKVALEQDAPFQAIDGAYVFFAWPMLIQDGQINESIRDEISHRTGKYLRTFLIQSEDKSPILGVTTKKMTLQELSESLQKRPEFSWAYSVVNLDGWPSTSIISKNFSHNTKKKLPWFFILEK